jgi:hypothetical protein
MEQDCEFRYDFHGHFDEIWNNKWKSSYIGIQNSAGKWEVDGI